MTVTTDSLRTLTDNLDEYIHIPGGIDRLKKMVLHLAVSGQLVSQNPSEGTGSELYEQIQAEKAELIKQGKIRKSKPLPEITNDEMPFQIPESWKWVRLGDSILDISGGGTPSKLESEYWGGDIPWASIKDLHVDLYLEDTKDHITKAGLMSKTNILKPKGSIVIGTRMGVGKVAILAKDMAINQDLKAMRIYHIDDVFFVKMLKTLSIEGKSGTTVQGITQDELLKVPIPLPPLAEQKRIVAKVDAIFALIDELAEKYQAEQAERTKLVRSSLAQLANGNGPASTSLALQHLTDIIRTKADAKALRQTILHLAVSGQLAPQNPSEGTGEGLYEQIQAEKAELVKQGKLRKSKPLPEIADNEIPFQIPESWKWVRQSDVFEVTSSKRVMQSEWQTEGVPFLRARDLTRAIKTNKISSDIYVTESFYSEMANTNGVPSTGDIMVSGVGTIGTPYVVKDGDRFYFKDATILWFKNIGNINPIFVKYILLSKKIKTIIKNQSKGTTVDTYTIGNARKNLIPLPPLAEQKRIVAKTTQLLDLVDELERRLEN